MAIVRDDLALELWKKPFSGEDFREMESRTCWAYEGLERTPTTIKAAKERVKRFIEDSKNQGREWCGSIVRRSVCASFEVSWGGCEYKREFSVSSVAEDSGREGCRGYDGSLGGWKWRCGGARRAAMRFRVGG